jgi:hypothetical protein
MRCFRQPGKQMPKRMVNLFAINYPRILAEATLELRG